MAKQLKNEMMQGASGRIGNTLFRQVRGKTVISALPVQGPRSEAQKAQAQKMVSANNYAALAIENPETEKLYSTGIKENLREAFRVAVADYMNSPVVHRILTEDYKGQPGDAIKINATDDFKVIRVHVEIKDSNDVLIEDGDAVRYVNRPKFWKYHITKANETLSGTRIYVTAFDLPGNKGVREIVLS